MQHMNPSVGRLLVCTVLLTYAHSWIYCLLTSVLFSFLCLLLHLLTWRLGRSDPIAWTPPPTCWLWASFLQDLQKFPWAEGSLPSVSNLYCAWCCREWWDQSGSVEEEIITSPLDALLSMRTNYHDVVVYKSWLQHLWSLCLCDCFVVKCVFINQLIVLWMEAATLCLVI